MYSLDAENPFRVLLHLTGCQSWLVLGGQVFLLMTYIVWWIVGRKWYTSFKIYRRGSPASKISPRAGLTVVSDQWRLESVNATLTFSSIENAWECHWCMPSEETWQRWLADSKGGLAAQLPKEHRSRLCRRRNYWQVWCFCGHEMHLEKVSQSYFEEMACHCGTFAHRRQHVVGQPQWKCGSCGMTQTAKASGEPIGIPCSRECKALRGHGHALVELLGKQRAYNSIFHGKFHFGNAGVKECIDAIKILRSELIQPQKLLNLKQLKKLSVKSEDIKLLEERAPSLEVSDAELLLHCYSAAGHLHLVRVLLEAGVCSVNARREKDGGTALHIAEYRQHDDVTKLLMEFGADPDALNKYGETPAQAGQTAIAAAPTTS